MHSTSIHIKDRPIIICGTRWNNDISPSKRLQNRSPTSSSGYQFLCRDHYIFHSVSVELSAHRAGTWNTGTHNVLYMRVHTRYTHPASRPSRVFCIQIMAISPCAPVDIDLYAGPSPSVRIYLHILGVARVYMLQMCGVIAIVESPLGTVTTVCTSPLTPYRSSLFAFAIRISKRTTKTATTI